LQISISRSDALDQPVMLGVQISYFDQPY